MMFKNYLLTAYRHLVRHIGYTVLNVTGLSVGIAASLLLCLFIRFETSFDRFHKNNGRLYRIVQVLHDSEGDGYTPGVPFPMMEALRTECPQLQQAAAVNDGGRGVVKINPDTQHPAGQKFSTPHIFYAEPQFFNLFSFHFLAGGPQCLAMPGHVILSQSAAIKYFGAWQHAVGQTITLNAEGLFQVGGVITDPPVNSDFPLQVVAPYRDQAGPMITEWDGEVSGNTGYVLLPPGMSESAVATRLQAVANRHRSENARRNIFSLQPISEVHFDARFSNYNHYVISHALLRALGVIGVFLLLTACVNFVNLATAQAVNRSKEVGLRKTMGSGRRQLVYQCLIETGLITLIAMVLGIMLAALALPALNDVLHVPLYWQMDGILCGYLFAVFVLVVLCAGLYPTWVITRLHPVTALKGKLPGTAGGRIGMRRTLVIFQFGIAQVLIIAMLVVTGQMRYISNADLGFNKHAVVQLNIQTDEGNINRMNTLQQAFRGVQGVEAVTFAFAAPSSASGWNAWFSFNGAPRSPFDVALRYADTSYFNLFGLRLLAGRVFHTVGAQEYVVNETFMKKQGITNAEEMIGKTVTLGKNTHGTIVGVMKDFKLSSLREELTPCLVMFKPQYQDNAFIRIDPRQMQAALAGIRKVWEAQYSEDLYTCAFLDKTIADMYGEELQLSRLYKLFAGVAIFISMLGLYGLVSFVAVQRRKEVGVRKVLGASAGQILYLFSREFLLLIAVAFCIAAPLGYYFMHQWLQHFAYGIHLGAGIFAGALLTSLGTALCAILYQSLKTATGNPVRALQS